MIMRRQFYLLILTFLYLFQLGLSAKTVKLCGFEDSAPYLCFDDCGNSKGYIPDVLSYVMADLKFEYLYSYNNLQQLQVEVNSSLDTTVLYVMSMPRFYDDDDTLYFSKPYCRVGYKIITKPRTPYVQPIDLINSELVLIENGPACLKIQELSSIVSYDKIVMASETEALDMIAKGKADYMVVASGLKPSLIEEVEDKGLVMRESGMLPTNISFMSTDKALIDSIDKSLIRLDQLGVLDKLTAKWLTPKNDKVGDKMLYFLLSFCCFLILLVALRNRNIVLSEEEARLKGDDVEQTNAELIESINQLINSGEIHVYLYELSSKRIYTQRAGKNICSSQESFSALSDLTDKEIERFHQIIASLDDDQREVVSICDLHTVNGTHRHYEYNITPIRRNGVLSRYMILRQDVSKIKLDLAKKEETINFMEMALSLTGSTVWKYDTKTKMSSVVRYDGTEIELSEDITKKLVHPSYEKLSNEYFSRIISGEAVDQAIIKLKKLDSDEYCMCKVNAKSGATFMGDSKIVYGVITDITRHYNAKKEVERLQNNLKLALDAALLSAWTYNIREDVFIPQHGSIFLKGKYNFDRLLEMSHPEDVILIEDALKEILLNNKKRVEIKVRLKLKDDNYNWFSCFMQPVYAEDGSIRKIVGTSRNITDEMKLNLELKNTKENLQTILDKMPIPICIKDAETQEFIYANYATSRLSPLGVDLKNILSRESLDQIRKVDMEILRTKINYSANEIIQLSTGELRYTTVNKILINYEGKEQILSLRYDYTDKHRLDQANKLLYISSPSLKVSAWNVDTRTMKVTYNNVTDMGGIPIENLSTMEALLSYVHPEDRQILEEQLSEAFKKASEEVTMTYRLQNYNQEYEWWESRAIVEIIEEGSQQYTIMHGMSINVNENKLNEISLINLNKQNELILNNHSSGIAYVDSRNEVHWTNMCNPKYAHLYDYFKVKQEQYVPSSKENQYLPNNPIFESIQKGKSIYRTEEWSGRILHTCFTPITDYNGDNGVVISIDDVTEKENMLRDLEIAKENAQTSERLKMSFLANMSHEIRTPLNAIVGFSQLLGETEEEDLRQEFVDIIQKNSDTLLKIIGDILDLSKIESGNIEVSPKQFDFGLFMNDTYKVWKKRGVDTNLEVYLENEFDNRDLMLDPKIIEQVVNNYMSNAFKYTPSGSVTLGCDYLDKGVRIYVRDTGIGVAEEKQHMTFQRFAKLDEFAQGTGLGLSICRGLAESCNGDVGFESEPGKGSTFWAFFPCSI